uniref:Uncharacterized protein n=1 Tax=Oryza sativa subsp. japonica TaxID=39947 RepID=Q69Y20_ORYSJ|nr:hypothetical protein [Oryza sativa Japonica Group]BAD35307.1 hypothetical protein [Oryza sativa Japonica Group]
MKKKNDDDVMMTSTMAGPRWRPRRRLDGRLRLWRTCTRRGRRDEPNGTHPRTKRRTTTAGDDLAIPMVATATDDGDCNGGAARLNRRQRRRRLGLRGGGARHDGELRKRWRRVEETPGVLI